MKLSVALITYNQEDLIGPCLDSILGQELDVPFEVVIGEDRSTDHTLDVVRRYEEANPDVVRVLHDRNHGVCGNFARTILACESEYVALAEGDDWWTDSEKLQRQCDYLDEHPDCALCYHDVEDSDENNGTRTGFYDGMGSRPPERTTIADLIGGNFIRTCSVVFRREHVGQFPKGFSKMRIGDLPLFLIVAQHGWMGFIDRQMSVYRIHGSNAWANADYVYRIDGTIEALENVLPVMERQYKEPILQRVFWWNYEAASVLYGRGDRLGAYKYAQRCATFLRARGLSAPPQVGSLIGAVMGR